jgi:single-stranded-DNA-specific exonuclease
MHKRWLLKSPIDTLELEQFRSKLKLDPITSELLIQRKINTLDAAKAFFYPDLTSLHDPFLMKDLGQAVERVKLALKAKEKILLFGDYDVDGTTAVALVYAYLKPYHDLLDYYIPDRYTEGYGVSFQGIDFASDNNFSLIITLDCGIRSVEQVNYAKEKGIDFIVCDHHNPGDELPNCLVLDPKRLDCPYPYKELSGCGVGFKLMQGLCLSMDWDSSVLHEGLDLLAVSIGADIVPVTGENRVLCFHGMQRLNENPRTAFKALLAIAKREFPVNLTDVVFTIAPRINAAGRLRSGRHAVELLISADEQDIQRIASEINADNLARRELDQIITSEALALVEADQEVDTRKSTVVFKNNWHKGVVGIVASRLIEHYYRPTIVLTESNGKATGSARTVSNFDIHAALCKCAHLLEQFGGHTHAAGLTLSLENVPLFIQEFESIVRNSLRKEDESPEQVIDVELDFDAFFTPLENRMKIPQLKRRLDKFEPYGPGNMKPVFLSKNVFSVDVRLLKEAHLKLSMTQPNSDIVVEGIGFNMADKLDVVAAGIPFDVVYTLEKNKWKNKETLQLNIKDIRPTN